MLVFTQSWAVGNVPTNATSATIGIHDDTANLQPVVAGTPMPAVSAGEYSYSFATALPEHQYTATIVLTYGGQTYTFTETRPPKRYSGERGPGSEEQAPSLAGAIAENAASPRAYRVRPAPFPPTPCRPDRRRPIPRRQAAARQPRRRLAALRPTEDDSAVQHRRKNREGPVKLFSRIKSYFGGKRPAPADARDAGRKIISQMLRGNRTPYGPNDPSLTAATLALAQPLFNGPKLSAVQDNARIIEARFDNAQYDAEHAQALGDGRLSGPRRRRQPGRALLAPHSLALRSGQQLLRPRHRHHAGQRHHRPRARGCT